MRKNLVIAIDGYSSFGKSTLAKALAKELDFVYINSGAMYPAIALYFIQNNVDINNHNAIIEAL
jgi:cytidylate kinase